MCSHIVENETSKQMGERRGCTVGGGAGLYGRGRGGGCTVEVDADKCVKRTYQRGRLVEGQRFVGGCC